jgi:hypothetical protein
VLDDLDSTLTQLVADAPGTELPELSNADVSFETPDRTFLPEQPTVDLFLHEVQENRELRDPRPIIERNGYGYTSRRPPTRADCGYLVTTWDPTSVGGQRIASEHRLLGQALTWLSRFGVVPDQYLQGALGDPDRVYPPPTMVAQPADLDQTGDFWTALGISPRPAFRLTVTVELTTPDPQAGPLVTTALPEYVVGGSIERPWALIGGRVIDQTAGDGLSDAVVDILELKLRTRTREEGRYSFPRVARGTHTVRVVATGFQPKTQPLVVPGASDDYLVELTPIP